MRVPRGSRFPARRFGSSVSFARAALASVVEA
jgi:hypothetical protein